jgi:hypothetical protein
LSQLCVRVSSDIREPDPEEEGGLPGLECRGDRAPVIDMAESAEDAGRRDAQVTVEFLAGEGRASVEQILIGPRGIADITEEQFLC